MIFYRRRRLRFLKKYPNYKVMKNSEIAKVYKSGGRFEALALMRAKYGVSLATARFVLDNYKDLSD